MGVQADGASGAVNAARGQGLEAATPRMLFRSDLGMRSQKMMEHMEENQGMLFVPARLGSANVIDNHVADFFQAVLLMHKIGGKRGSGDLGEMLMFRDSEHLLFGQAA